MAKKSENNFPYKQPHLIFPARAEPDFEPGGMVEIALKLGGELAGGFAGLPDLSIVRRSRELRPQASDRSNKE